MAATFCLAHCSFDTMTASPQVPLCSRQSSPDRTTAEVRIDLPVELVAVLDFLAAKQRSNRTALVERFTRAGLQEHLMDARMLVRMVDGNPSSVD
jgi:hypothetical protein